MKSKIVEQNKSFCSILFMLLLLFVSSFSSCSLTAYAEEVTETVYTNVLDDLSSDENFTADDYPEDLDDYSLSVIQLAESSDGELFIYVYQPTGQSIDLRATSINISTAINDSLYYVNYTLTYINNSGTLYKYLVNDFTVLEDALRYYDISSIYRTYKSGIDEEDSYDNTTNEVAFEVAQQWSFSTVAGVVSSVVKKNDVVVVTDKYVGFIRYTGNFTASACDSHFVAFSTDYEIDELYEADVTFISYTYKMTDTSSSILEPISGGVTYEYGEDVINYVSLIAGETSSSTIGGLIKYHFSFDEILSVDDFIASLSDENITLSSSATEALNSKQWVLNFYQSNYKSWSDTVGSTVLTSYETGTIVSSVTILRLKFETCGEMYNLGVVDNKTTGSEEPSGETESSYQTFWEWLIGLVKRCFSGIASWWEYIIFIFLCVIVVLFLVPIFALLPTILSVLLNIVRWVVKGIWWIIKQIAKGIVWVFTSIIEAMNSLTK